MSLPPSFSGMPTEEQHHHFRNICIDFKKAIKTTKNCGILSEKMDRFLNASRQVAWQHDLENNEKNANLTDLLSALALVDAFVETLKVR